MKHNSGKPDHVAIFVPSLRGGGAERIMVTLANAFAARGIKVDLVLVQAEGPYLQVLASNVRVIDLRASRVSFSLPALVNYLRRERPKAMLSALNHANVIALIARRLSGVKLRLVVSERNDISSSSKMAALWRVRLLPSIMRRTYPWADGVIAISKGVSDSLARSIGLELEKIEVIYNPIDIYHVEQKARQPIDHPLADFAEIPVILGVGRLVEQKDFHTLIRAFAQLLKKRPARLLILGEGILRNDLKLLVESLDIRDQVAMPGFTDNPFFWMKNASVFVLSSAWEGFGNVLVEAMACGTPVVSTNCPSGPAEILEDGKWGRLVPVGDIEALANALEATLDEVTHPDVKMRAADFSVDVAVDKYLKVLGISR